MNTLMLSHPTERKKRGYISMQRPWCYVNLLDFVGFFFCFFFKQCFLSGVLEFCVFQCISMICNYGCVNKINGLGDLVAVKYICHL